MIYLLLHRLALTNITGFKMYFIKQLLLIFILLMGMVSCGPNQSNGSREKQDLIIFHAGSLSRPMDEIAKAFEKENPEIRVLTEAAGSRECARKITELHKPCDIIAVADYAVIENLLMPEYADWLIQFAGNEMCIAFTESSRLGDRINSENWFEVLLDEDVFYGRSDPELDPCGYRTVLAFQLAEKYYGFPGLEKQLLAKDHRFIRPKETDLLSLLESHAIDYIMIYRSVAQQHGLKFIHLPGEVNLGDAKLGPLYATSHITLTGKTVGKTIIRQGEPMIYGLAIPLNAPNSEIAIKFLKFMLSPDKGMEILKRNGQPVFIPARPSYYNKIPGGLKAFVSSENI